MSVGRASGSARRWRIALHALDRTGPPVLARAVIDWLAVNQPSDRVEVVSFRGGELLDDFVRTCPVHVLLDPSEVWDHARPDPDRVAVVRRRAAALAPADATLLVSVAAGQVLDHVPDGGGPTLGWVVEQGSDLHWLGEPLRLADRVDAWIAGSTVSQHDLASRASVGDVPLVPEFVDRAAPPPADVIARCRAAVGAADDRVLVMGAGIGTYRKGMDLFLETALRVRRRVRSGTDRSRFAFAWLGGERDELFPRVRAEIDRLGLDDVRLLGSVGDVVPWFAAADVLLHTAREDAFPLVCLHAASVGTPIVGFAGAGGLEEMLGPTFVGAPFPDLAGVSELLTDMGDARRRAVVGASQAGVVNERYTTAAAAPTLYEAMCRVAANGRAAA